MPLNVGDTGYGSVAGPGLSSSGAASSSETAALLVPEPQFGEEAHEWRPMSKEELEESAGGPGWRRLRWYLVVLFWLVWLAMLAIAVAVILTSPRPVATPLAWWQESLFFQLQPDLFTGTPPGSSGAVEALCDQLPYLKSLGISALVLKGFSDPLNTTENGEHPAILPYVQHLLNESNKAGFKLVLDVCDVQHFGDQKVESEGTSDDAQYALRFWLSQGVAGFLICDTDAAFTQKWRHILEEFSKEDEERIVVVKQTREVLPPLKVSSQHLNITLVDVVLKTVLPESPDLPSDQQVANAIETHLQTPEDTWLGWMIGCKARSDLRRLLLVLLMTLPGSPVVQYDQLEAAQGGNGSELPDFTHKLKSRHSEMSLFKSLSHSRAREEALLFGSFTFLPFNKSSNATESSSSSLPILAFLRSWGCVHFLVLLNVGPEVRPLNPTWAPSLPEAGVFVASSAMDRLGAVTLDKLVLQPREAVVVKLFEPGSYS
ncbi:4F2 cell-surface antigen heavy chain isoform X2 [Corythoichthys intestinalis]|uniref:4F2 cell-surface antigen heavy chain isoform X2 n=1 Tax=Corythoichthys intestinalis TaxID=161448 RepID=UPI0025A54DDE|nr:4F2 cell-surface antigen heavy chain isoform X2 [Corythoichthys intestinalis]